MFLDNLLSLDAHHCFLHLYYLQVPVKFKICNIVQNINMFELLSLM